MSQNQEIIEAKLCAYIDGELDGEGRAEIEKHLEANPQHRRLLESLKATRDLIRWLPREPAPAELAETLNGQLERSVLLDYDGAEFRPSIWPRALAAAAIVLLTVGLAAAVYLALPRSHNPIVAVRTPSNEPAQSPTSIPDYASNTGEAERSAKPGDEGGADAVAGKAGSADNTGAVAPTAGKSDGDSSAADQLASNNSAPGNAALEHGVADNAAADSHPPDNKQVVVLVRSDQPAQAARELTQYFASNQIHWSAGESADGVLRAPQLEADRQQTAMSPALNEAKKITPDPIARAPQASDRAESMQAAPAPATPAQVAVAPTRSAPGGGAGVAGGAGTKNSDAENLARKQQTDSAKPFARDGQGDLIPPAAGAAAALRNATQPIPDQKFADAQNRQIDRGLNLQQQVLANGGFGSTRNSGVYVARMSRRQAADLASAMSRDRRQFAEMRDASNTVLADGLTAENVKREELTRRQVIGQSQVRASQLPGELGATESGAARQDNARTGGAGSGFAREQADGPTSRPLAKEFQAAGQKGSSVIKDAARSTTGPAKLDEKSANVLAATQAADEQTDVLIVLEPAAVAPATQPAPTTRPAETRPAAPSVAAPTTRAAQTRPAQSPRAR